MTSPVTHNDEVLSGLGASQGLAEVIPANPSTAGEDFTPLPGANSLGLCLYWFEWRAVRQTSIMIT